MAGKTQNDCKVLILHHLDSLNVSFSCLTHVPVSTTAEKAPKLLLHSLPHVIQVFNKFKHKLQSDKCVNLFYHPENCVAIVIDLTFSLFC